MLQSLWHTLAFSFLFFPEILEHSFPYLLHFFISNVCLMDNFYEVFIGFFFLKKKSCILFFILSHLKSREFDVLVLFAGMILKFLVYNITGNIFSSLCTYLCHLTFFSPRNSYYTCAFAHFFFLFFESLALYVCVCVAGVTPPFWPCGWERRRLCR